VASNLGHPNLQGMGREKRGRNLRASYNQERVRAISFDHRRPVRIGVLGGIGPEATGEFYNKLIAKFQERGLIKTNRDFPQIVINSIPAPELIYDTISDEDLKPK
jgi:hypothetical protein